MKRERVFGGKIDEAKNKWSPRSRMDEADRARISSECLSSQVKTSLPFFISPPFIGSGRNPAHTAHAEVVGALYDNLIIFFLSWRRPAS